MSKTKIQNQGFYLHTLYKERIIVDIENVKRVTNICLHHPQYFSSLRSKEMNVSEPTLVEGQLIVLREWCDQGREMTECMCDNKYNIVVSDLDDRGFTSDLAMSVDWWTEGLVLPSICLVGILGELSGNTSHHK